MSKIQVADTEEENCCYLKARKKKKGRMPEFLCCFFSNMSLFNEELASEEEFPFEQMLPFTI